MRLLPCLFLAVTAGTIASAASACSSTTAEPRGGLEEDAATRVDGGLVDLPPPGAKDAAPPRGPEPSCTAYCGRVMDSCTADHAQYRSHDECLAMCALLPPGKGGETEGNTLACREYYAGTPARTDAPSYCASAGPFGGRNCGDRCTAFCQLTLAACSPDAGKAPYRTYGDCQADCAEFAYEWADAGDAGGDDPYGPSTGDTLNCRLFHLREAVADRARCADLAANSATCR